MAVDCWPNGIAASHTSPAAATTRPAADSPPAGYLRASIPARNGTMAMGRDSGIIIRPAWISE